MRSLSGSVVWLLVVAGACGCTDRSFPSRPLTIICPWSKGGGTDSVSRRVAAHLEPVVGQPVHVINAIGGNGVTGHSRGARARPDGYTLTMMTVEINMLHWRGLTDLTYDAFEPLVLLNRVPAALFVRSDSPWETLAELKAAVAKAPGELMASGTSRGGIWHLALAGWLKAEGLSSMDVTWVPMTGAGPSLQELVSGGDSGGLHMACCSLPEAQTLLRAGRIRSLGVMAAERVPQFAEVPTFIEQGVDWSMGGWRGIGLPRGVTPERKQQVFDLLDKVLKSEAFIQSMKNANDDVRFEPLQEFERSLEEFDEKLGALLRGEFANLGGKRFGPYFFPRIIGAAFVLVLLFLCWSRGGRRQGEAAPTTGVGGGTAGGWLRLVEVFAVVAGFAFLLDRMGFVLSSALALFLLLVRTGNRWAPSMAIVFLLVPAVYSLFALLLKVPLPRGIFGW